MASPRRIELGRADLCVDCGCLLDVGVEAWWDSKARAVTCPVCRPFPSQEVEDAGDESHAAGPDRGDAGASALREYERRRANREERTREAHPLIGEALLAVRRAPKHETAFRVGAAGETAAAESLEKRLEGTPVLLMHDRRMPRGRGNIDHLAVAPTGIYVIDAKNVTGKVRVASPLLGKPKLTINGRDRTKLIDGLDRQVAAVTDAMAAQGGSPDVPIYGVLCFIKADLPLIGQQRIRGHRLLYRRALVRRLKAAGPLEAPDLAAVANHLAAVLPPA